MKTHRVLKLAMGLRSGKVAQRLARYGFTERDLHEGLDLLQKVVRMRLDTGEPSERPELLKALDSFENEWLPVVRLALGRRFPAIADQLLANLGSAEGVEAAVVVATLVERVIELEDAAGRFGAEGVAARELLAERGLTNEVIERVQHQLGYLRQIVEEGPGAPVEEVRAAEDAMWAWYLEWSGLARKAITDRRLLRRLGFLQNRSSTGDDATGDDETDATLVSGVPETALPALSAATTPSSAGQLGAPQLAADNDHESAPLASGAFVSPTVAA